MVQTDTLEGMINGLLWFHYDVSNDVLYLRLASERQTEAIGDETEDGLLLMRRPDSGVVIGMTVINWWKRFGRGALPDSIRELEHRIEPWAQKLAA